MRNNEGYLLLLQFTILRVLTQAKKTGKNARNEKK